MQVGAGTRRDDYVQIERLGSVSFGQRRANASSIRSATSCGISRSSKSNSSSHPTSLPQES